MKPKRYRVALSLPDDIDEVLTGLAHVVAVPKTHLITQLLRESLPSLTLALDALQEQKKGNKSSVLDAMRFMLEDAGFNFNETKKKYGSK